MKLRFLTAGESHGPAQIAILEGTPAGLSLGHDDIQKELDKRRSGAGRSGRGKIEPDSVKILSGVRFGLTLGSPICVYVENQDFIHWQEKMSGEKKTQEYIDSIAVSKPRPGHADLAGLLKYNFRDLRNVLERASARETIMRVAVGAICKVLLLEFDIKIASHTVQIGTVKLPNQSVRFQDIEHVFEKDPDIRCIDEHVSQKMKEEIIHTTKNKDTLGGVVEVRAVHVPVGLGSFVHFDRKLDGSIAQALMSIPSVKAVEIGTGITNSSQYGSVTHDEIYYENTNFYRKTNRAGGIEGGVSNGEEIIARVYHKPISTLGVPLTSVNIRTKQKEPAHFERSDVCVVPRAGVISEAMLAFVLTDAFLEKFSGDSLSEIKRNFEGYQRRLSTM